VELFLSGDWRHGCAWRAAVPVLLARREPDHVTRPNWLDRAAPALCQAAARRHDQGLAQRVGVPRGPSAGLERDTGAERACRSVCLEQGVNAHRAGKILGRSFAGGLGAASFDVHILTSFTWIPCNSSAGFTGSLQRLTATVFT